MQVYDNHIFITVLFTANDDVISLRWPLELFHNKANLACILVDRSVTFFSEVHNIVGSTSMVSSDSSGAKSHFKFRLEVKGHVKCYYAATVFLFCYVE